LLNPPFRNEKFPQKDAVRVPAWRLDVAASWCQN
jgi:hypothetical protein